MKYKDWQLFNELPDGWLIDKTAGSPLAGHAFITNGKSVINGQERGLLKIKRNSDSNHFKPLPVVKKQEEADPEQVVIDDNYVRTVNELARQKFKQKILNDILVDLMICEIEGWCKLEYINEIKQLIDGIARAKKKNNIFRS